MLIQGANQTEEGEMTSDFEDIILADEEIWMRVHIEESEARNLELERIAWCQQQ